MGKFIDLTGQRFGKLVVIEKAEKNKFGQILWLCKCDCGNETKVISPSLNCGATKSCGCLRKENTGVLNSVDDMIGKRFGKLVVLEKSNSDVNGIKWLCQCDCGNTKIILGKSLRSGRTKSCGCLVFETKDAEEVVFKILLSQYRYSAKRRNFIFDLTEEEIKCIIQEKCYYCGKYHSNITKYLNEEYSHNGIDRVDNSKGYVRGNVVPCCETCNRAKLEMGERDFYDWIDRVHDHIHQPEQILDYSI